jgi:hypothetical protein
LQICTERERERAGKIERERERRKEGKGRERETERDIERDHLYSVCMAQRPAAAASPNNLDKFLHENPVVVNATWRRLVKSQMSG